MKVKVGDMWYSAEDVPVLVQLTPADKVNIANMLVGCDRYVSAPDSADPALLESWANEGYTKGA